MTYTSCRAITVTVFMRLFAVSCSVQGIPQFTEGPPSVLYVSSGGTARFVWDYNTKNRSELFDPYSPVWFLYNTNGTRVLIGLDDGDRGWNFTLHKDCPARLCDRVSKESTATLVISNVTTADSGVYECSLVLLFGSRIRSIVRLTVTDSPRFTTPVSSTTVVPEGSNLSIHCSATASPLPNVTWVRIMNIPRFVSTGVGEAFLRFDNITRHQSGTYECQATNNPYEDPETVRTKISAVRTPAEPTNLSVSDINVTSALIKWLRPLDDGGSPITEYKIQINTIPPRESIIKATYHIFKNLNENTTYGVKVYARNGVGYGKTKITEFTTKRRQTRATTTTTTVANKRQDNRKDSSFQSMYFFQGRIFAIIHLTITCVLVVAIIFIIPYFYIKFKRNLFKVSGNREEIRRLARTLLAQTADEEPGAVALTTMEHAQSAANNDSARNASNISPNKDYERISEKSESSFDSRNAAHGTRDVGVQLSEPQRDYQELNTDVLMSNLQGYQTLNRTEKDNVTKIGTVLPSPKYEPLKFVNHPKNTEYQKPHLYASIGDKK